MKRFYLFFAFFLCFARSYADDLYVPSIDYPTIQSAINDANDGDTVIVSPDTYMENINFPDKAITVTSTDPNDPNVVALTIIDGNEPADANFGSVVTFNSGEDNNSVLTGFTITGGSGSWLLISWEYLGLRWNRCGGGVVCYNMSAPTITKNIFINNTASQGGGIYIYGDPVNPNNPSNPPIHISPIIKDNIFVNNTAVTDHGFTPPDTNYLCNDNGDGGAVVCFQGCDAIITGNIFQDNGAYTYGGAVHLRQWCNGRIESNYFINNSSMIGAAIHLTYSSSPYVTGNYIESNHSGSGGAIYVYYLSEPVINQNIIRLNSSLNGIIGVHYGSGGEIKNNIIEKNTKGATIILTGSSPSICHNTIYDNEKYGILCNGTASPEIENNIIAGTKDGYGIAAGSIAEPTIRYNDVWNNELGNYGANIEDLTGQQGNISVNPMFIDEPTPFLHLYYTSVCINAGDPNFVAGPDDYDNDGDPRILHGRTDIGADEVNPVWNLTKNKQYPTIQTAIDDSNDFDEIIAIPGTYLENISINNKLITLRSIDDTDWNCIEQTIIDGGNTDNAVVSFSGTEDSNCVISGFTITRVPTLRTLAGGIKGNGSTATIRFCLITGNNSMSSGGGINNADGLITNCKIINNIGSFSGGGLYGCDGTISNCIIADNQEEFVGGGGLNECNGQIINNTIVNNTAAFSNGGLDDCNGTITNNIIWSNNAPNHPGCYDCNEPTYCCLQESSTGEGNIYTDPLFVDANNGNYHLTIYSDCIDKGDNNSVEPINQFDINYEPRIFTYNSDVTARVDIGADEVVLKKADFNANGVIDHNDLNVLTAEWLASGEHLTADLSDDNEVNFQDQALFAQDWYWQAPWYSSERETALQFDNTTDGYVWIHTPQGCILNNVFTFTYTAWIYPLDFPQTSARIIGKNEKAFIISTGGVLKGYSHGGGTATSSSVPGTLQANKWYFVAMIYDYYTGDKLIHLYVDGKEVDYQVQSVGTEQRPPLPDWRAEGEWDLHIGSMAWYPGTYVPDATIDEVAIYSRVLTEQELEYLYNNGFGRPSSQSLNPIGLWHFDEIGTTAYDSSGYGNDGQLQGTTPPQRVEGKFFKY